MRKSSASSLLHTRNILIFRTAASHHQQQLNVSYRRCYCCCHGALFLSRSQWSCVHVTGEKKLSWFISERDKFTVVLFYFAHFFSGSHLLLCMLRLLVLLVVVIHHRVFLSYTHTLLEWKYLFLFRFRCCGAGGTVIRIYIVYVDCKKSRRKNDKNTNSATKLLITKTQRAKKSNAKNLFEGCEEMTALREAQAATTKKFCIRKEYKTPSIVTVAIPTLPHFFFPRLVYLE